MKRALLAILLMISVLPTAILAREQPPPPTGSVQRPPPQPEPQPAPQPAPKPGFKKRLFFGGGIGFGFGDLEWIDISPMVGVKILPRLSAGVGLTYRHTKDSRYDPELSTSDLGGDVFAQLTVFGNVFAMAEYEYLNYEYYTPALEKTSDSFGSVLVGGGIFQPMGGHAALVFSALYNLSYSENEPSPYGSPWVYSAGVSVGF